jgi:HEAT repeat protein
MNKHLARVLNKTNNLAKTYTVFEIIDRLEASSASFQEALNLMQSLPEPFLKIKILQRLRSIISKTRITEQDNALAVLTNLLTHDNYLLRQLSADCLFLLWLNEFVAVREQLLGLISQTENDPAYLSSLIESAGILAYPELVPVLTRLCDHEDFFIRKKAVEALGRIGGKEVVVPLVKALYDSDKEVRESALWGLDIFWVSMKKQAVPLLIETLGLTNNQTVKNYLLKTLRQSGDARALPILQQHYNK